MSPTPGPHPAGAPGPPRQDVPRVVVVCQANVCRSRAADVLLRERATAAGLDLSVQSAGTRADSRATRCRTMEQLLRRRGSDPGPDLGIRLLDADLLESADLVLVAEQRHRAHAARLLPSSRPRTFTVLEAAALVQVLGTGAAGPARTRGTGGADGVRHAVEELHAARGRVRLVADPPPWRFWGRSARPQVTALDLADVHAGGRRPHERALGRLDTALGSVVGYLGEQQVRTG